VRSRAEVPGHTRRGFQLNAVALPVIEREAVALEPVASGNAQAGGGVEPSAEEADGFHKPHDSTCKAT
jgi:hypothetical protein